MIRQFYRMVSHRKAPGQAGGLLRTTQYNSFIQRRCSDGIDWQSAHRIAGRSAILGSRLLPTCRTAMLQNGSPPGIGQATPLDVR
jgi:hypothetical protein